MKRSADRICFDASCQYVVLDGNPLKLQAKALRVLTMIMTRSPNVVRRDELIAEVWSGNHVVGERGLNQALWAIRAALGDSAREPSYIRTVPREGYQWLGAKNRSQPRGSRFVIAKSLAVSVSVVAIVFAIVVVIANIASSAGDGRDYTLPAKCEIRDKTDVRAYQVNRDVFVDIQNGCRLIAKPEGSKIFGNPTVSDDGRHVGFTVTEDRSCRFVTVALQDGQRTEFDRC